MLSRSADRRSGAVYQNCTKNTNKVRRAPLKSGETLTYQVETPRNSGQPLKPRKNGQSFIMPMCSQNNEEGCS